MRARQVVLLLVIVSGVVGLWLHDRCPAAPTEPEAGGGPPGAALVAESAPPGSVAGADPRLERLAAARRALEARTVRGPKGQPPRLPDRWAAEARGEGVEQPPPQPAADPEGPRGGGGEPQRAPVSFPTDRDGIRSAMALAVEDLRECYEAWLQLNPALGGKVIVTYRIVPDEQDPKVGRVVEAAVKEGGLGNQLLDGCVLASLGPLEFEDPPAEGLSVTYPLLFTSDAPLTGDPKDESER